MNKEQSVYNKLHKFSTKEVELSAQEPMKVELALTDSFAGYVRAVNNIKSEGSKFESQITQVRKQILELANLTSSVADDAARDLVQFEKACKELGIAPNSNSEYKAASAAFDELVKLAKDYRQLVKG
jgi:phage terminase small subunit